MTELTYFAIEPNKPNSTEMADMLNLNPTAYNYRKLTDPKKEGQYLIVNMEGDYPCYSRFYDTAGFLKFVQEVGPVTIMNP